MYNVITIMNNISFYNHKYNTIKSLLTKNGNINSAILRRDWFKKLDIYKEIKIKTKQFDIFKDFSFTDRILVLINNIEIKTCKVCGEKYVFIKKSNHMYRICNHKFNVVHSINSNALKKSYEQKEKEFYNILKEHKIRMNEEDFKKKLDDVDKLKSNYSFVLKREDFYFFNDLIIKTEKILPLKSELEIPERIYIIKNNIKSIPTCIFCDKQTYFNNRIVGFSKTCKEHRCKLGTETRIQNNKELIDNNFNFEKYEIEKYPEILTRDDLIIKCKKCGNISEWRLNNGKVMFLKEKLLCRNCENPSSKMEEGLFDFLKSIYNGKIIHHLDSRTIISPYELDFFIPEKKLAIEYDGIYWHSETNGGKERLYHLKKTLMCEEKGIQLIHIFENEWIRKNDIVKSRLKNMLGIHDKTIFARKCKVKIISNIESKIFQDENHLQGGINASINIGLFYDNTLISVMTFRKPRMTSKYEWELLRFCNKLNYHVIGGAGKLLKYFERNYHPKSLISYADRRWSKGNLYERLGFQFVRNTKPNYWYFKGNKMFSRIKFQKHKLKNILKTFDKSKSEWENMAESGYNRIFDCGNMVFVKDYI